MDVITQSHMLKKSLLRCAADYDRIAFATAWASTGNDVFEAFYRNRSKIRQGVIGTHFFQTDPKALSAFVGFDQVRTRLQPSGVFHPKVYLFGHGKAWEAFVGSANLTRGALSRNSEVVAHFTSSDASSDAFEKLEATIRGYFEQSDPITGKIAADYAVAWKLRRRATAALSGEHDIVIPKKSPLQSGIMTLSWSEFYQHIQEREPYPEQRVDLLQKARQAFTQHDSFSAMSEPLRYMIAGLETDIVEDAGAFGKMVGNGKFYKAIKLADRNISAALDEIPLSGLVDRDAYDRFLSRYRKSPAFPSGRYGVGTVTRLLALKRPDQFICLDEPNQKALCRSFGIPVTNVNYERYWDEIIEWVRLTPWWNSPRPSVGLERDIWNGRTAFLDSLFYGNPDALNL